MTSPEGGPPTRASPTELEAWPGTETPEALAPVGLGVARPDGTLVRANAALAHALGHEEGADLVGTNLSRYHAAPSLAADVLGSRLAEGPVEGLELDVVLADGKEAVVCINARVRPDETGARLVHFAVTSVRPRDDREETASRSQKMEAVERFAAGVAHDYNNLLTTIIGETRQLLSDLGPNTDSHESANTILRSAKRAAEITQRLLVFSRAEEGRPEAVDLNEAVRTAEAALAPGLGGGVSFVLRLDEEVGPISIDPAHLHTIVANLTRNASEAMPSGGRIVVETATIRAPHDTAGLDFHPPVPPGVYASVAVGDTGTGMDPTTRRRVFDPFFTTKDPGAGAGLGLTTVYGLVLRASGHLAVISAPAWGTLVRVLLPAQPEPHRTEASPPVAAQPPVAARAPESRQRRILVVDDDGSVLRVISRILRRAGYIVYKAENGYSAQDEIRRHGRDLDLVISDVMMPRMKGTELMSWLRERSPETPILLVSGYADSDLVREWVAADPDSFLPKPFEPDELIERVRVRLGDLMGP